MKGVIISGVISFILLTILLCLTILMALNPHVRLYPSIGLIVTVLLFHSIAIFAIFKVGEKPCNIRRVKE